MTCLNYGIHRRRGFTLLEMLLVLAISSSLILLMVNFTTQKAQQTRRDKTVLQMEQILNAGMSYYVNNSQWPITCDNTWTALTAASLGTSGSSSANGYGFATNYVVNITASPYGQPYQISCAPQNTTSGGNFYVSTTTTSGTGTVKLASEAMIVAGSLPMAYITTNGATPTTAQPATCKTFPPGSTCTEVIASVNVPGQNLNNARSLNFAGIYYSGSCVPAPACPTGMSPSIVVAPAAVSGINDAPTGCSGANPLDASDCTGASVYPISSFSAFARGADTSGNPGIPGDSSSGNSSSVPISCDPSSTSTHQACFATYVTPGSPGTPTYMTADPEKSTKYWRVCLAVVTEKGFVDPSSSTTNYVQMGKIMGQIAAFTRCVPNSGSEKPSGSSNVYQWYH